VAYDEDLADRIRALLGAQRFTEKKMFGGLAFLIGGNMSVAASGQGGLLVRVDPAQGEKFLKERGASEMTMGGRGPMKGWLRVEADAIRDARSLRKWVARGVDYAKSLPAK
jgi:TfoX/Sxy family transcriptional regulator of competence genes